MLYCRIPCKFKSISVMRVTLEFSLLHFIHIFCIYTQQIDSMLPCVCSVIYHRSHTSCNASLSLVFLLHFGKTMLIMTSTRMHLASNHKQEAIKMGG